MLQDEIEVMDKMKKEYIFQDFHILFISFPILFIPFDF
jgi:hypothetical protein